VRTIPDPGFAGDDGKAPPAVADAQRAVAEGAPLEVAVAALCAARVLVPVVAMPGGVDDDPEDTAGAARDKTADMAAVLLTGRDGRRALLAFTGLAGLRAWDADARPVPVTARDAARAALSEGADALVVDVAGPVQVPVEGDTLRRIADGDRLVRGEQGWFWAVSRRGACASAPRPAGAARRWPGGRGRRRSPGWPSP
jgi:hypothetical protein